jgi:inner membrane protein
MTRSIFFRLAAIGGVTLLLMVPLMQIHGLVRERQQARDQAVADIARGSGLAQQVTGPLLVIPVVKTLRRYVDDDHTSQRHLRETEVRNLHYFLPERLAMEGELAIEARRRGIYEARLYRTPLRLSGHFQLPAVIDAPEPGDTLRFERPWLAVGVTDIRGIGAGLAASLGEQAASFESGARVTFLGGGVHAALPPQVPVVAGGRIDFSITLPLQGTAELRMVPVGRETTVRLRSDWPHPGFVGDFLPVSRSVSSAGFEARWQTSFFATNLLELIQGCAQRVECRSLDAPRLGVSVLDPVDHYLKSERAIKYALLFIALTFAGFLLCEVLKGATLHPVQYGLVGLSLALFYLLLLSLSEHLGFALAYALSAAASVSLLTFFLVGVLRSRALGTTFGTGLVVLHCLLYGILSAEDYALLMGSLLLFGVLALFMVLTRRVDWALRHPGR